MFQDFNLIPTLTALENVELALLGRGFSTRRRLARAAAVLERVGLAPRMDHLVPRLSGGERQRVAIARAIVNEPKLLLADEPTGNLDSVSAANVADLLFRLRETTGMTLVLVDARRQARRALRPAGAHPRWRHRRQHRAGRRHRLDRTAGRVMNMSGLALRNLRRRPIRTGLSILGIALAVGSALALTAFRTASRTAPAPAWTRSATISW